MVVVSSCGGPSGESHLHYEIVSDTIPKSLTGLDGNAERGEAIFREREAGHCVLCHQIDGLNSEFQGNLGPDLTFVGERLTPEQLRLRIVDYQAIKAGAVMPSYFRLHDLYNVSPQYLGQTILLGQDIEDVIAFLAARKG